MEPAPAERRVHALQKPNRTIITATKSGTEKNATVFPRYWIEALRDPAADTDKNEVVSALEAFKYAEAKTKEFYETKQASGNGASHAGRRLNRSGSRCCG